MLYKKLTNVILEVDKHYIRSRPILTKVILEVSICYIKVEKCYL